jgi:dihydroxyacetone kinase-like predicted kinase
MSDYFSKENKRKRGIPLHIQTNFCLNVLKKGASITEMSKQQISDLMFEDIKYNTNSGMSNEQHKRHTDEEYRILTLEMYNILSMLSKHKFACNNVYSEEEVQQIHRGDEIVQEWRDARKAELEKFLAP